MPGRGDSVVLRGADFEVALLLATVLAVCTGLTLSGLASPAGSAASMRLHPAPAAALGDARAEAARIARYWTPARMRSTPPLGGEEAAEPFASASFLPVPDATAAPYAVNGRIFIRQGDKRGTCSGTAINTPTRQLVLTAGHCVNSGPRSTRGQDVWSRYLKFVPAYSNGLMPFGAFVARRGAVYAPKQWVKQGNPDFDVGAFLTFPNGKGQNVADAVGGGATIAIDKTRHQDFETFGYPGAVRQLQRCSSPYVGDDVLTYPLSGPPTIAIRCQWGRGASGGGWLIEGGTTINGLTSYGHRNRPKPTYGPYFSSQNVGKLVRGL